MNSVGGQMAVQAEAGIRCQECFFVLPSHSPYCPCREGRQDIHSIEGLEIKCGKFYGRVKQGRCSECGREVLIATNDNILLGELKNTGGVRQFLHPLKGMVSLPQVL